MDGGIHGRLTHAFARADTMKDAIEDTVRSKRSVLAGAPALPPARYGFGGGYFASMRVSARSSCSRAIGRDSTAP